ncbi:MAG: chemotaxis protein CheA [Planctomycetota bacterium]
MADTFDVDPELLQEFLDETLDGLGGLSALFLRLEAEPREQESLQAIFRTVHSIKGNAAFFGLLRVQSLAHQLEEVLDQARNGRLVLQADIIDRLLRGTDVLMAICERVRTGEPEISDTDAHEQLLADLAACLASPAGPERQRPVLWQGVERELVRIGRICPDQVGPLLESLQPLADQDGVVLRSRPDADTSQERIRLETLLAGDDGDPPLTTAVVAELENCITALRDAAAATAVREAWEHLLAEFILFRDSVGIDGLVRGSLRDSLHRVDAADIPDEPDYRPNALDPLASAAPGRPEPARPEDGDTTSRERSDTTSRDRSGTTSRERTDRYGTERTMRVREDRIDGFLDFVGQLLVVGGMYEHLHARMRDDGTAHVHVDALQGVNAAFEDLSQKLRSSILAIRQVPVRPLVSRAPRLVRDIARASGKRIQVVLEGEEVQVDKSHLDLLDGPFVHLVRNAADHGIEPPEQRQAAGKEASGTVTVTVERDEDWVHLRVADDGAGIDTDAVLRKARELGLVDSATDPGQAALVQLVFSSGLSTAASVTDVSGRGVGMDAVRAGIEAAGGRIAIDTVRGGGTTVRIDLPVAVRTRIGSGLFVVLAGQTFVLPLDRVRTCLPTSTPGLVHRRGDGHLVQLEDVVLDLHDCGRLLDLRANSEAGVVVIVRGGQGEHALLVDAVAGVREMVVQHCPGLQPRHPVYQGAALQGDGGIALVFDVDALVQAIAEEQRQLDPVGVSPTRSDRPPYS